MQEELKIKDGHGGVTLFFLLNGGGGVGVCLCRTDFKGE